MSPSCDDPSLTLRFKPLSNRSSSPKILASGLSSGLATRIQDSDPMRTSPDSTLTDFGHGNRFNGKFPGVVSAVTPDEGIAEHARSRISDRDAMPHSEYFFISGMFNPCLVCLFSAGFLPSRLVRSPIYFSAAELRQIRFRVPAATEIRQKCASCTGRDKATRMLTSLFPVQDLAQVSGSPPRSASKGLCSVSEHKRKLAVLPTETQTNHCWPAGGFNRQIQTEHNAILKIAVRGQQYHRRDLLVAKLCSQIFKHFIRDRWRSNRQQACELQALAIRFRPSVWIPCESRDFRCRRSGSPEVGDGIGFFLEKACHISCGNLKRFNVFGTTKRPWLTDKYC